MRDNLKIPGNSIVTEHESDLRYPVLMKRCLLLVALLLLPACGGRKMNDTLARNLIIGISSDAIRKSDVEIVSVRQISASEAIAETRALVAFRFENTGNIWRVREMRIGHGQWESVENIERALNQVKTEETKELLTRIAEAIHKYREVNQQFPAFKDYVDLSDKLAPRFLTPLLRLDAWQRPFEAYMSGSDILLRSAGLDGIIGNQDDIELIIPDTEVKR